MQCGSVLSQGHRLMLELRFSARAHLQICESTWGRLGIKCNCHRQSDTNVSGILLPTGLFCLRWRLPECQQAAKSSCPLLCSPSRSNGVRLRHRLSCIKGYPHGVEPSPSYNDRQIREAEGKWPTLESDNVGDVLEIAENGTKAGTDYGHLPFKYRMRIAYDGTDFQGWQLQASGIPSVQLAVENAICRITRQQRQVLKLVAASRTDAGVHARGQVVHFYLPEALPDVACFHAAMNSVLPQAVRILEVSAAPPPFHARYSPLRKTYHYAIHSSPVMDPLVRLQRLHVPHALNREAMAEAASHFPGVRNFSAFANHSPHKDKDPVRNLLRFQLVEERDASEYFHFEVEGQGFLYKQVRNMVGLLLKVGMGSLPPTAVPHLLASCDRHLVALLAPCAPAHGLCLDHIVYPEEHLMPPGGSPAVSLGQYKFFRERPTSVVAKYSRQLALAQHGIAASTNVIDTPVDEAKLQRSNIDSSSY